MSSASFSSNSNTTKQKGFSESDIQNFLQRGSQLASRKSGSPSIGVFKPKERTLTTTTSTQRAGGIARLFGASNVGTSSRQSGFLGQFASGIDAEQLDALTQTFLQRQKSIQQRRAQPGRSALFLARTT